MQIKFLAIREAGYLKELDDRRNDCPKLTDITDLQLADAMADEIDTWVRDALAKGVLSA